jgi:glucose dehydrogenase
MASLSLVAAWALVAPNAKLSGQSGLPSTRNGEWTHYTADVRGSRYSPLDQINATTSISSGRVAVQDRQHERTGSSSKARR